MIRRIFRLPFRRGSITPDIDAELSFHIESRIDELQAQGRSPDEARAMARKEFGDLDAARADLAEIDHRRQARAQSSEWWDGFRMDAGFALRGIRRDPLFTTAVVLTLGLGLGVNATVFGVLDRLVLRPPAHVVDAGSVAKLYLTRERTGSPPQTQDAFSYPMYVAIRERAQGVEGVAAAAFRQLSSGRGPEAIPVQARLVTSNYFALLGVRPASGRFFAEEETAPPSGATVAVLGWEFWRRRFGADPSVVGKTIPIGQLSYTVIGIAPPGLTAMDLLPVDVWLPISAAGADGMLSNWHGSHNSTWLRLFVRIKPGATLESVSASAGLAAGQSANEGQVRWKVNDARALPIFGARTYDGARAPEARVAIWLAAVAFIVLLIACANVTNMLLARARRREREIAVRVALGIGRARLATLFGMETVFLAILGAGTALLLAHLGGGVMRQLLFADIGWSGSPVDGRVLAVTGAITLLTALVVGIAPALHAGDTDIAHSLRAGLREAGRRTSWGRTALLVAQPALSVLLLVGAGLFVRSLSRVRAMDIGYEPERVLIATMDLQGSGLTPEEGALVFARAREAALRIPGVSHAALGATIPFDSDEGNVIVVPGRTDTVLMLGSDVPSFNTVTPTFFATLGIRLVAGRGFTDDDERTGMPRVAIVNETFARTAWPDRQPLGECMRFANDPVCITVVGIAHDARRSSLLEEPSMQFYLPLAQGALPYRALFIRTEGDPALIGGPVVRMMQSLEPDLPYAKVYPFQHSIDPQVRSWVLASTMFGIFGGLALLVAAIGVYSVLAYAVAQRGREIGVRMALGASSRNVLTLVLSSGMRVAVAGVSIGSILALVLSRKLEPLLFDTSPRDPVVFISVAAAMLLVALLASAIPAWRAAQVDPVEAIREE